MAVTTTYYGKLDRPEIGENRLIVQVGSAKWVAKTKTLSLKTDLKYIKSLKILPRTGAPMKSSGMVMRCTGTVSAGKIVVTRATASKLSGAYIWYEIIGTT